MRWKTCPKNRSYEHCCQVHLFRLDTEKRLSTIVPCFLIKDKRRGFRILNNPSKKQMIRDLTMDNVVIRCRGGVPSSQVMDSELLERFGEHVCCAYLFGRMRRSLKKWSWALLF